MKAKSTHVPPMAEHYRLARGVHLHADYAVCDYPLRIVHPGAATLRLLAACAEQRTPGEVAIMLHLPLKRVEQLCEQLRWKGLLEAGSAPQLETLPGVSIIIPSYNRAEQLERCLHALLQLEYPPDKLEVIIVDDCSSDGTHTLIGRLAPEFLKEGISIGYLRHTERQGPSQSRNDGAEAARFDLLAFLDSDCVVTSGWLAALVPAFTDPSVTAVGGQLRARERHTLLGRYEDKQSSLNMGSQPQRVTLAGPLTYLPTANLLMQRAALREVGGFAPIPFGEDVDLCRRLLLNDGRILYLPQAIVLHDYRVTMPAFLRTRAFYASSEALLLRRHPATRRVLLLPPEQGAFAGMSISGLWGVLWMVIKRRSTSGKIAGVVSILTSLVAILITISGTARRLRDVRRHGVMLHPLVVLRGTLRGYLAYTYHLCRHITRYYTLPLLIVGIIVPPLLLLLFILCGVVIGIDYVRLRPNLRLGQYALCSLLDDCAYEVGVVLGCIKERTWKPLIPLIRLKNR